MLAFLFLSSCSILFPVELHYSYKLKVPLLDENKYKQEIIISLYSSHGYELQVTLSMLINYITFRINLDNINKVPEFIRFTDSLFNINTYDCKIESTLIKFDYSSLNKFNISQGKLFETGDNMIYDTKSITYLKEVEIESDIHYRCPLNATYSNSVLFGGFFFKTSQVCQTWEVF
jgi:hypothetical protein